MEPSPNEIGQPMQTPWDSDEEEFETVEGDAVQSNVATPFYSYHMDKSIEQVEFLKGLVDFL